MEEDRIQMFLRFMRAEEVRVIVEAASAYKRKPSALAKLVILEWTRAVKAAGYPPLKEYVPSDTFTRRRKEGD